MDGQLLGILNIPFHFKRVKKQDFFFKLTNALNRGIIT